MIYITSDIHIPHDVHKIGTHAFTNRLAVKDGDILLICGDFGGVWNGDAEERYWLRWLSQKPYTTLFIDGNHENHRRLADEFPVVDYSGGQAHKISRNIFHLMRGYVFNLEGKQVFAMGGAASHDKEHRIKNVSWWPEELPSPQEYDRARKNLDTCGWAVDYVISHCAPTGIQQQHFPGYETNALTDFLEDVSHRLQYRQWYFGHYHQDIQIDQRHCCLYHTVMPLGDTLSHEYQL